MGHSVFRHRTFIVLGDSSDGHVVQTITFDTIEASDTKGNVTAQAQPQFMDRGGTLQIKHEFGNELDPFCKKCHSRKKTMTVDGTMDIRAPGVVTVAVTVPEGLRPGATFQAHWPLLTK